MSDEAAVAGYEYGALCPECGYFTNIGTHRNPEGFVCGEDHHLDDVGCGRTLCVLVEVVEGDSR